MQNDDEDTGLADTCKKFAPVLHPYPNKQKHNLLSKDYGVLSARARCAGFHYQDKDLHNSGQLESFIYARENSQNSKNNSESNTICNRIPEIWSKICFVYAVTLIWKGFLSSEMVQIADNSMKKRLRQVIFMSCPTFKLSHHKNSFSSNLSSEIFDSDRQGLTGDNLYV